MYTLGQMITYVRDHMDLGEDDLPNSLLVAWAREASMKIARAKHNWPFLEWRCEFPVTNGTSLYSLTDVTDGTYTVDEIVSVIGDTLRLHWISRDTAEQKFERGTTSTGVPYWFSVWGNNLEFWPTPSADASLTIRGYRKPLDWAVNADGAGNLEATPDFPDEFHDAIRLYMLGCAFLQQEDVELANSHFQSYEDELNRLKKTFGESPHHGPFVIGGGNRYDGPLGRLKYNWE